MPSSLPFHPFPSAKLSVPALRNYKPAWSELLSISNSNSNNNFIFYLQPATFHMAPGPSKLELSAKESKLLCLSFRCFRSEPQIDWEKLARVGGYANPRSCQNMYGTIKRKLNALAEEGDGGPVTPSKGRSGGSAPSTPASSRKRKAAEKEEDDDSDEEESAKKAKKAKKATKEIPVISLDSDEDAPKKEQEKVKDEDKDDA
ncbi:hypothetical protein F5Y15DRAFT_369556 [Xylariaceae sp. FL0016]|nr:hypothetical protein F5Y15DRAFT_369556 [Xylariaceae sp. FL0016]